jgi:Protein of unknown function (DUF1360)
MTTPDEPTEPRPIGGYARTLGVYAVAAASATAAVARWGRPLPERIAPYDVALLAVATHKTSRTLTKDAVTSPLRAGFTEFVEPGGPGELNEEVTAHGPKHAVGELLTCPFCMSQWIATGFTTGLLLAPRATRVVMTVMSVRALSDALQLAYAAAQKSVEK